MDSVASWKPRTLAVAGLMRVSSIVLSEYARLDTDYISSGRSIWRVPKRMQSRRKQHVSDCGRNCVCGNL